MLWLQLDILEWSHAYCINEGGFYFGHGPSGNLPQICEGPVMDLLAI